MNTKINLNYFKKINITIQKIDLNLNLNILLHINQ
jgi:hypothetical protein